MNRSISQHAIEFVRLPDPDQEDLADVVALPFARQIWPVYANDLTKTALQPAQVGSGRVKAPWREQRSVETVTDVLSADAPNARSGSSWPGSSGAGGSPRVFSDDADVIHLNDEEIANWISPEQSFNGVVYAGGGDDLILRDRTGSSVSSDGLPIHSLDIYGLEGIDTINYFNSALSLDITLADVGGGIAFMKAAPWDGVDFLYSIENVVGSNGSDTVLGHS